MYALRPRLLPAEWRVRTDRTDIDRTGLPNGIKTGCLFEKIWTLGTWESRIGVYSKSHLSTPFSNIESNDSPGTGVKLHWVTTVEKQDRYSKNVQTIVWQRTNYQQETSGNWSLRFWPCPSTKEFTGGDSPTSGPVFRLVFLHPPVFCTVQGVYPGWRTLEPVDTKWRLRTFLNDRFSNKGTSSGKDSLDSSRNFQGIKYYKYLIPFIVLVEK